MWEESPVTISTASAIPARSAPMLNTLAARRTTQAVYRNGRGYRVRIAPARPWPDTIPMRAQTSWIAAISGYVTHAVQSIE